VTFKGDISAFNEEISGLVKQSMELAGMGQGMIWFMSDNHSIMKYMSDEFILTPDGTKFIYDSTEYIMRKDRFDKTFDDSILEVKPFEEMHIDKYLEVLNDAMSFFIPLHDFVDEKPQYLKEFREYQRQGTFEAFWQDDNLVGLYWNVGNEVDTMGISSEFQRRGYGSLILTRAIEMVFRQNPVAEYAILYCVGWNAKAQNFYKRYGMEINGQHKVPYEDVNPVK